MSIQLKRCTSTGRQSSSTVLKAGQPLYETDTSKLYIGDGATASNALTPVVAESLKSLTNGITISGPGVDVKSMAVDINGSSSVNITAKNGTAGAAIYLDRQGITLEGSNNSKVRIVEGYGVQSKSTIYVGSEVYGKPPFYKSTQIGDNIILLKGSSDPSESYKNFTITNDVGTTTMKAGTQLILEEGTSPVTIKSNLLIGKYEKAPMDGQPDILVDSIKLSPDGLSLFHAHALPTDVELLWPSDSGTIAIKENMPVRHIGYFTVSDKTDSNLYFAFAVDKIIRASDAQIYTSAYMEQQNIAKIDVTGSSLNPFVANGYISNPIKCTSAVWYYTG